MHFSQSWGLGGPGHVTGRFGVWQGPTYCIVDGLLLAESPHGVKREEANSLMSLLTRALFSPLGLHLYDPINYLPKASVSNYHHIEG